MAFAIIAVLPRVPGLTHISPVSPSSLPSVMLRIIPPPFPKLTTIFIAPPPLGASCNRCPVQGSFKRLPCSSLSSHGHSPALTWVSPRFLHEHVTTASEQVNLGPSPHLHLSCQQWPDHSSCVLDHVTLCSEACTGSHDPPTEAQQGIHNLPYLETATFRVLGLLSSIRAGRTLPLSPTLFAFPPHAHRALSPSPIAIPGPQRFHSQSCSREFDITSLTRLSSHRQGLHAHQKHV